MTYETEQEAFWAGSFGDDYIQRNQSEQLLSANIHYFNRALAQTRHLESCIELGANVGMNLRALGMLFPDLQLSALVINRAAAKQLTAMLGADSVFEQSLLDFDGGGGFDLAFVKGVLIHINPDFLSQAYDALYLSSRRYILLGEYYNPSPVAIAYRGHGDRLFKRDFCGEMLDRYADLQLVDYGFSYHRDNNYPQDDISWFLMEKR
jgi:spore coat polysaccharide biosynthesis protein SpsF